MSLYTLGEINAIYCPQVQRYANENKGICIKELNYVCDALEYSDKIVVRLRGYDNSQRVTYNYTNFNDLDAHNMALFLLGMSDQQLEGDQMKEYAFNRVNGANS